MAHLLVIFDRKHTAASTGRGKVELQVRMNGGKRKYLTVMEISSGQWPAAKESRQVLEMKQKIEKIFATLEILGEPFTMEALNRFLDADKAKGASSQMEISDVAFSLTDFMRDTICQERVAEGTAKMKRVVLRLVEDYGKLQKLADLTPKGIGAFDDWLRKRPELSDVTIYGYHKIFRFYVRKLIQLGLLMQNPYDVFKVKRGHYKERAPLTEEELLLMRSLDLPAKEARVRDLFIFSAYTGLSYCDAQQFNFKTMTEKHGDLYYIDGSRLKTGTKFFTPILPPALEVLERYDFRLPTISNQKMNDYLHLIQSRMNLNKELTCHVARHSFATLSLTHDVPIEKVARMLGHTDIRTTQVYAKILKSTIERHAANLADSIL